MTVLGAVRPFPGGGRDTRRQHVSRAVALPRTPAVPRRGALPRAATPPRGTALPRTGTSLVGATPRRKLSRASRVAARAHPARALIGGVLICFLIGLIYLAQTVNLAATNYEIDRLAAQSDDLYRQVQTVETNVLAMSTEQNVLERAQRLGLGPLPTRVRLSAR